MRLVDDVDRIFCGGASLNPSFEVVGGANRMWVCGVSVFVYLGRRIVAEEAFE